jgi:ATP-dependent RNA helicase DeaD
MIKLSFKEIDIHENIKGALRKKGFSNASEIQAKVIPAALSGQDIVGKSRTGTGKTAAFAIPLVEMIRPGQDFAALIVVPTRELALQVKEEIASIAEGSRIKSVAVFGGESINKQINLLRKGPEIIVGTPGRIIDLYSRGFLKFQKTSFLVLDEADKMLDMGFRDDVEEIISRIPRERQTMLFSATLPDSIQRIIERNMKHERLVFDLSEDNAPVQEVEQFYLMINPKKRIEALCNVLNSASSKSLVFCRTKRTVDWLERQLSRRNIRALAIHGDKSQNVRRSIIEKFKRSKDGILIATDIVSRGIHVDDIGSVINFDLPQESETYLHRIGRTARQGRKGRAISFCSNVMELQEIERAGARSNAQIQEFQ